MWGATVISSRALVATAQTIRGDSLMLKVRAQGARGVAQISGASDRDPAILAVLIVSVILERPTCLLCITAKVGDDKLAVVRTMERIGKTVEIVVANDERCR